VEGWFGAPGAGGTAFGPDEAEPETGAATSSAQPNASDTPSAEPAAPVADPLAWENVMAPRPQRSRTIEIEDL
jgi:hypothetical protein